MTDPERERVEELSARLAQGGLSSAEGVELRMHLQARPELRAHALDLVVAHNDPEGWMARVEADAELQRAENTRMTRIERAVGLGLFLPGFGLCFLFPLVGGPLLGLGAIILAWSVLRVRLKTFRSDPYRDIQQ